MRYAESWRTAGADDSGGVHFSVRRRTRVALRVNACITLHELAPSEIFQPQIPEAATDSRAIVIETLRAPRPALSPSKYRPLFYGRYYPLIWRP
ncbi:hypothetical protein EVAR_102522_1 [Eumeta japonica]|uniref:Uncharacterized protein n=1 Tax=Eumeta variegata TaxID=151549 RepID=A0A4C1SUY4_EUMVA|nr:hypothetical protein EVAR_102522_1 [Eumeta japonica]